MNSAVAEWLKPDDGQDRFRALYANAVCECVVCGRSVTAIGLPDHYHAVHGVGRHIELEK